MSEFSINKPLIINLPITEICDSKCVMCNVWKDPKTDEFIPEKLYLKFSNPFYSNVKHLGISGGEPTLNEFLIENIKIILKTLKKLKSLSMTSHGFHTDRHMDLLPVIKDLCNKNKVNFSLNLSVDGIEEVHIKIRRIKDAFKKVSETALFAKKIGIHVQLQTTVSKDNIYNIVKVREFAMRNGYESIFRVATKISRLYNENLQEKIALSDKEKSFFADFLESNRTIAATNSLGRRLFYKDLAYRLKTGAGRKAPCSFQSKGLFLSPIGEIYNCSLSENPLKIQNNDPENSIDNLSNRMILKNLIKNKCNTCLHDQSGRWSLWHYLKVHNLTRKYYLLFKKFEKVFRIFKDLAINSFKKRNTNLTSKTSKILIIGMYGGEHVGDAAILGGVILRFLNKTGINNYDVLSIRKDRTKCWVNNLFLNSKISVLDNDKNINPNDYDSLVLAGGPIMNIPLVLLNHIKVIASFKRIGKPFYIEGVGYGPLNSRISKLLSNKIIKNANSLSTRTCSDFEKVKHLSNNIIKSNDPAFDYLDFHLKQIKPSKDKFLNKLLKSNKKICVINLRPNDKTYTRNKPIDDKENMVIQNLVSFCNKFSDTYKFVFMPMNSDQFGFCDLEMAYKLEHNIKGLNPNIDYSIWETETTINDCLLLLNKASLTISMRFHGCIFSLSTNTPTIGIDYSSFEKGKVYSLFKSLNKENQVISINDFSLSTLEKIKLTLS